MKNNKKTKRLKKRFRTIEYAAQGSGSRPVRSYQNFIPPPTERAVQAQQHVANKLIPRASFQASVPSIDATSSISSITSATTRGSFPSLEDIYSEASETSFFTNPMVRENFISAISRAPGLVKFDDDWEYSSGSSEAPIVGGLVRPQQNTFDETMSTSSSSSGLIPMETSFRPIAPDVVIANEILAAQTPIEERDRTLSGEVIPDSDTQASESPEWIRPLTELERQQKMERSRERMELRLQQVPQVTSIQSLLDDSEERLRIFNEQYGNVDEMEERLRTWKERRDEQANQSRTLQNEIKEKLANVFGVSQDQIEGDSFSFRFYDSRGHDKSRTGWNRNNECFEISVDRSNREFTINHLRYPGGQPGCKERGYVILEKLGQFATEMGFKIKIGTDAARRTLSDPAGTTVDYAHYKILTEGQSYYNTQDYLSRSHFADVEDNSMILNKKVIAYSKRFDPITIERIKNAIGPLSSVSVRQVGKYIRKLERKNTISEDDGRFIQDVVNGMGRAFSYTPNNLYYTPNGRNKITSIVNL
jgi:hypothetical protein